MYDFLDKTGLRLVLMKIKEKLNSYALKSLYGDSTINVGRKAGTTIGDRSTAEGIETTASGMYSHAEGHSTEAIGDNSHSEGYTTNASGRYSHAEGCSTKATGDRSHSEGDCTNAVGWGSHAEGGYTTASGQHAHAEGWHTTASGSSSHASGYGTVASHDNEASYGKYNESKDNTLFSIGDGTADDARHNAFEITTTGGKLHDDEIMTQNKISNPNLLINPDFKINQRLKSGTIIPNKNADGEDIHTYFVDRWGIDSGSVTINADGTLTLNGTISQILENSVGTNVTASVSAGTVAYDDSTKIFTVTGNGDVISWAKLERGDAATAFVPPEVSTELLKCMRYYEILIPSDIDRAVTGFLETNMNAIFDMKFSVPKRCAPSLTTHAVRIVVNTIGSYVAIKETCPIRQGSTDKYGISIVSDSPVISSSPSGYIGVTMDTVHTAALSVDAEIY